MRPEEVPQYARLAALDALVKAGPGADTTGVILAAVIPTIRNETLESAAVEIERMGGHAAVSIAAAIRAMKEPGT